MKRPDPRRCNSPESVLRLRRTVEWTIRWLQKQIEEMQKRESSEEPLHAAPMGRPLAQRSAYNFLKAALISAARDSQNSSKESHP